MNHSIHGIDLAGKRILVTGGSSGIGLALARVFAGRGDSVSLLARTPALLQAARDALLESHPDATVLTESVDVADDAAVIDAIGRCEAEAGACDILVTSAGIVQSGLFDVLPA